MPEGGDEAEVRAWRKRPGQRVGENEPICLVDVHGFQAEVTSPAAGTVARLLVGVASRVTSGQPLAEIAPEVAEPEVVAPEPELEEPEALEPEVEPGPEEPEAAKPEPESGPAPVDMATFRSPAVRRLASLHSVDLDRITGTGRDGRITKWDVEREIGESGLKRLPVGIESP